MLGKFVCDLGNDFSGQVKLYEESDHRRHAVKTIPVNPANRKTFERDVKTIANLKHSCVLEVRGLIPAKRHEQLRIVTEFAPNGTLEENMRQEKRGELPIASPTRVAKMLCGIVLGMRFAHSRGVIHGNLKPSNILLDSSWRVRIGDFGVRPMAEERPLRRQIETIQYRAPEFFDDGEYTKMMDVYSFGLILYEVLVGRQAFPRAQTVDAMTKCVVQGVRAKIPRSIPHDVRKLMKRCWSQTPDKRPTFQEIHRDLKAMQFRIVADVKSAKVIRFVAEIKSSEKAKIDD
jgi:serine/threonine protein kinase